MTKIKKIIAIIISGVLLFSFTSSAFAISQETQIKYSSSSEINDIFKMEKYVTRNNNGLLELKREQALSDGNDPQMVDYLFNHFNFINNEVKNGKFKVDKNLNIIGGNVPIMAHRCSSGRNSFSTYWWGFQIYTCNCKTKQVSDYYNGVSQGGTAVAGVSGALALIFPPSVLASGIIGASSAVGAGYFGLLGSRMSANNRGRGVIVNMTHMLVFDVISQ